MEIVGLAAERLAAGDVDGCRRLLFARGGGPELPLIESAQRSQCFELLTYAELTAGRLDAADRHSRRAAPGTRAALRARAAVLEASGEKKAARRFARAAAR